MFSNELVDTNSPEIRAIRGERQFLLENQLHEFKGLSYVDRFFKVRDTLFEGMRTTKGSSLNTFTSEYDILGRVSRELAATVYLPAFVQYIDAKEIEIANLDGDEKEKSGFRLATLVYLLGLTIHQSADGNTQGSNIIALSYLRQFCPEYTDKFFPIKYSKAASDEYLNYSMPVFESTLPPDLTPDDQQLFESIKKIRALVRKMEADPDNVALMKKDYAEYEKVATNQLRQLMQMIQSETQFQFSDEVYKKLDKNYGSAAADANQEIATHLTNKYSKYTFSPWGASSDRDDSKAQQKHLLTTVLSEPEGSKFLDRYIQLGAEKMLNNLEELSEDQKKNREFIAITNTLQQLEHEFKRVLSLEDRAKHQEQHQLTVQKGVPGA
ncbi:MAG: hypothetical protein WAU07_02040 [Microgenomates group bacterium]